MSYMKKIQKNKKAGNPKENQQAHSTHGRWATFNI